MPTALVSYEDTLIITSNTAEYRIPVQGTGIKAPDIAVNVTSFTEALNSNTSVMRSIIISNNGDSTLNWKVKLYTTPVSFTKANFADWTLPQNHDKITPTVAIARKDFMGLFNIIQEDEYNGTGPLGTQWAEGYSDDLTPGDYGDLSAINNMPYLQDVPLSLYLTDDDLYIDFMITAWTGNGQGGGYSYEREGAVYWIDRSVKTGSTVKGDEDTLQVTFDATDMITGTYLADIILKSNDPDQPELTISTTLTVPERQLSMRMLPCRLVMYTPTIR